MAGRRKQKRRRGLRLAVIAVAALWFAKFGTVRLQIWKQEFTPHFASLGSVRVIDVPFIDQREKYPTGCESVSAVMAMQYLGIEITPETFIDRYLPCGAAPHDDGSGRLIGDDPNRCFLGSPYSADGWGCYAPVIAVAMRKAVSGKALSVEEHYGKPIDELLEDYVNQGVPVLLWATIDMAEPADGGTFSVTDTGQEIRWVYPSHCLLLVGADEAYYYFNDPMQGPCVPYSKGAVERAYAAQGAQAVTIIPAEELP